MVELQTMYKDWPFFREMIDLIAMTLSKTDYSISANYELQLVNNNNRNNTINVENSNNNNNNNNNTNSVFFNNDLNLLGEEIRDKLVQTRKNILKVTRCDDLSNGFQLLQQYMKVRYPYVDPLNILQTEILRRLRNDEKLEANKKMSKELRHYLEDSLIVSINGIAQGMKNSG
jgi:phosphoenolpyruvate carboxylase